MSENFKEPGDASPFHSGEQELQTRVGKREQMERHGRRAVLPYMPEQHRAFFAQLPFLLVGSVDGDGWPWVSLLSGKPGFVSSPDTKSLNIKARPGPFDPLLRSLEPGKPLGLLGIELTTRRRNRMNGRITEVKGNGLTLEVDQAFGNCPRYIQSRPLKIIRNPELPVNSLECNSFTTLESEARALIAKADTLFVSSYVHTEQRPMLEGVDVSHRGGKPGFVRINGDTLMVPDYAGNNYFNTLGNFLLNPKAGLMFADFATGDLLLLTGRVDLLWSTEPEVQALKDAQRAWRFTLDHGVRVVDALPFREA